MPEHVRSEPSPAGTPLSWTKIAPILVVHFCSTLGFSIGLPFLIFLVADFGGAAWTYGLLGATYSAAQMVGAPILGRWSDRTGRRTVLLVSQGGTAIAWIVFLVATQLPREPFGALAGATLTIPLLMIFGARLLDGLTAGNISVANAYIADITQDDPSARQVAFGRMGMAASLGFTLGPALAGLLGAWGDGYTGPIIAALVVSLVGVVLCIALIKPTAKCPEGGPGNAGLSRVLGQEIRRCDRSTPEAPPGVFSNPKARLFLAATFLIFLAFNVFYASFPLHATQGIGWSPVEMGAFFSLLSAAMVVVQGPVLQRVSRWLSSRTVFGLGIVGLVLAFLVFPVANGSMAVAGALLFALGNGLSWATFQAQTTRSVPANAQGALQGAVASAGSLASILGLTLGGVLYPILQGSVFMVSSVVFVAVLLTTPRLFPREQVS